MVIILRSSHRVKKYTHLERIKTLKCLNTFVMIVFVYMFAQRECELYFYVKRDCLLFSVNMKLFFEFSMMCEKANKLLLRESVFVRGIGDPPLRLA